MRSQRVNKFNMAKQAQTYDAQARYVKLWVPELDKFPPQLALSPWLANAWDQTAARCTIGIDYAESVAQPKWALEAQTRDEQRNAAEPAQQMKSGYSVQKRRWHHGRNGSYLAS